MSTRNLYNRKDWILGTCVECGKENYVEPHGLTAQCQRCGNWTEHESIPDSARVGMDRITVSMPALRRERPLLPLMGGVRHSTKQPRGE